MDKPKLVRFYECAADTRNRCPGGILLREDVEALVRRGAALGLDEPSARAIIKTVQREKLSPRTLEGLLQ